MERLSKIGQYVFAATWIVIAIQHFLFADFLETLVPSYMPARGGWVYFTGICMMAAGAGLMLNFKSRLASFGIVAMLVCFILLLHVPLVSANTQKSFYWTRALQDITVCSVAMLLTGKRALEVMGGRIYAAAIIIFGLQHFLQQNFVTAGVPDFLPFKIFWDCLTGILLIGGGIGLLIPRFVQPAAHAIAITIVVSAALQMPALIQDYQNPISWIMAMLELAIASGALILLQRKNETNLVLL